MDGAAAVALCMLLAGPVYAQQGSTQRSPNVMHPGKEKVGITHTPLLKSELTRVLWARR